MTKVVHNALGINPDVKVVGSSLVGGKLLLRSRTTDGRTIRYVACYDPFTSSFKYFRRVTSTERKRLGKGESITCPLEELAWERRLNHWEAQWKNLRVTTLTPQVNFISPTDYTSYVVNGEMISNHKLKEIIQNYEDPNH